MKKTISINIGGIIFHIEEDGYEKLKQYLDSINKYFSTFEESAEIMSDIEGRIAELFLMKLNDGRQTLNLEDINELIATMGTTTDFEASIEGEDQEPQSTKETNTEDTPEEPEQEEAKTSSEPKRLLRDTKRGILGGVAAGISHYFGIDPLWARLLFLALLINIFFYGLSTAIFVAYIVLWIVIPPAADLPENTKVKKLFRNDADRVLGGVSSGIAAYFGVDVVVIRLLFVLTLFLGGSGALLYIALWIITPVAKTVTEKMQMSGEPVTLKNIESTVKKSFKINDGEEKPLAKILLFPFRLLAALIQGIGRILGPLLKFLVDAVRVIFGAILLFTGFVLVAALVGLFSGLYASQSSFLLGEFILPLSVISQSINAWMLASVMIVGIVPAIMLAIIGLVIISKRWLLNAAVGWSLFALWICGIIIGAITIPRFVSEFQKSGDIKEERKFEMTAATPTLKLNDLEIMDFHNVDLVLRGQNDSTYTALIETESRGKSRLEAEANAALITYDVTQRGDDFYFNSAHEFLDSSKFRFQHVTVTFFIPYNKVFRMEKDLADILFNTIHRSGYKTYDIPNNDWVFKPNKGLVCLTCEGYADDSDEDDTEEQVDIDLDTTPQRLYDGYNKLDYPFENFSNLIIGSVFDIEVVQGNSYEVSVFGDEDILEDVFLNQVGDRLEVSFKRDDWEWWKKKQKQRVKLSITMPELNGLEIAGACNGEIFGFDEEDMSISLEGISEIYFNSNVKNLEIEMDGLSVLNLKGKGKYLDAEIDGASKLNGRDFLAEDVEVETDGASKAKVFGSRSINAQADGASSIRYKGSSNISIREEGMSSIEKY